MIDMMDTSGFVKLYEQELAFLRKSGDAFAQAHPSIAASLKMQEGVSEDPHVSRLIQSFAFLNARTQQRLEDDVPELSDALLERLYPHYCRPIPAMSIAQMQPAGDLDQAHTLPAGMALETAAFDGRRCQFQTAYPVTVQPIVIQQAKLLGLPLVTPGANQVEGAKSVLQVQLNALTPGLNIMPALTEGLSFYLSGDRRQAFALQALLMTRCLRVVVTTGDADPAPLLLEPEDTIAAIGFGEDEGLLPYPAHAFLGYRLLTEFFAFPEKFLFFKLQALASAVAAKGGEAGADQLNLYFYFDETNAALERSLDHSVLALGCTPVVNLFEQRAEPIVLTQEQYDYPVVPDARHPEGLEVYTVNQVTALDQSGKVQSCLPLYGQKYEHVKAKSGDLFWHTRRSMSFKEGSEVAIHLSDQALAPMQTEAQILDVKAVCFNGDIPAKLVGQDPQLSLFLVEGEAPLASIRCMTTPTRCQRPPLRNQARWRLIAHLSMNHLQLSDGPQLLGRLQELLALYNFDDSPGMAALIDALVSVQVNPTLAPLEIQGRGCLCRGTDIELVLDPIRMSGHSAYLFGAVMSRFFSLYTPVNTFTQLTVSHDIDAPPLFEWGPSVGARSLI